MPKESPKVFKFITGQSKLLAWRDLAFSVQTKGGRKDILKGLTGQLRPGELTCILGPSGSGKTSLLNILAGRVRPGGKSSAQIGGQIAVGGRVIQPSSYQHVFGYVMQDDALMGTMTPREVMLFGAKLRLSGEAAIATLGVLDDMLESLGLTGCADTMVGNELIKGISGGERKRTAVGAELITNPEITFLDEPTSGLDTASAFNIVSVLKSLTSMQQSVLCTIHQPSSEIFHLFDQSIFLFQGSVVYHGPPTGIREHFEAMQLVCPEDYNPADFVMFTIQMGEEDVLRKVMDTWSRCAPKNAALELDDSAPLPISPSRKSFAFQQFMLARREFYNTMRDKGTLGARFGSTAFLTVLTSLIFYRLGDDEDPLAIQGGATMLGIFAMFMAAQPILLTFTEERPVFMRETASEMYGTVPYFLSKTVIEIPLLTIQNFVMWFIAYWLIGFHGNFFAMVLGTVLIGAASSSASLVVGSLVADAKQAMELVPALFVPQILFAGFFIKMELIPPFLRWLQYICGLKWGMNHILLTEFGDVPAAQEMLSFNDVSKDDHWFYIVVLCAISVLLRSLAVLALARKRKAFYN